MATRWTFLPTIPLALALISVNAASTAAQSSKLPTPDWQIAAGGNMTFDTASVRQNTTAPPNFRSSNFPLGPGDVYIPNGGRFSAVNFPLINYIFFAYKVTDNQVEFVLSQLPKWATTDRFDVQAHVEGNPTKDQMRLMMQALLANRFRVAAHHEIRQLPVYALLVDQPGRLGPLLQKHTDDAPCPTTPFIPSPVPTAPPQKTLDNRFPSTCGGIVDMTPSAPGRLRAGARNVTMQLIADSLTGGVSGLDRPVWDRTELIGKFDFAIEFTPQGAAAPGPNFRPDPTGPTFVEALRKQLGLKLEDQTGPVDVLVIDYVEQLSSN